MSKGINIFNHFNPTKSDGHKLKGESFIEGMMLYCPKKRDVYTPVHTSNGIMCSHCGSINL